MDDAYPETSRMNFLTHQATAFRRLAPTRRLAGCSATAEALVLEPPRAVEGAEGAAGSSVIVM
jgi:hypothetical protein